MRVVVRTPDNSAVPQRAKCSRTDSRDAGRSCRDGVVPTRNENDIRDRSLTSRCEFALSPARFFPGDLWSVGTFDGARRTGL